MTQKEIFDYLLPFGEQGAKLSQISKDNRHRYYCNETHYISETLKRAVKNGIVEKVARGIYRASPKKVSKNKKVENQTELNLF